MSFLEVTEQQGFLKQLLALGCGMSLSVTAPFLPCVKSVLVQKEQEGQVAAF